MKCGMILGMNSAVVVTHVSRGAQLRYPFDSMIFLKVLTGTSLVLRTPQMSTHWRITILIDGCWDQKSCLALDELAMLVMLEPLRRENMIVMRRWGRKSCTTKISGLCKHL